MINQNPKNLGIKWVQGEEHDSIELEFHNEMTTPEMADLFRKVLQFMGYGQENIDEIIPDPYEGLLE